jgi:uncharacterized 2Fe-2S/4Fe-4S cluster protein (DUF4445 family)
MILRGNGQRLQEILTRQGFSVEAPCGGKGICGKCRVLVRGDLGPLTENETDLLTQEEIAAGWRLACMCRVFGEVSLEVVGGTGARILTEGGANFVEGAKGLCAAVDVGTTTIAAYLVRDGMTIDCEAALNPQRSIGADVITRVDYTINHEDGLRFQSALVRRRIDEMIRAMALRQRVDPADIRLIALVGNPIMTHILSGIDPRTIAVAPYSPAYCEAFYARGLIPCAPQAENFVGGCVAGYVGSDTIAAVMAADMDRKDEISLLLDIGTNGEIALGGRGRMLCCAAAAGPAFEGAHIKCGSRAVDGAIDRVWVEDGQLRCHVIGEGPARSICGSGLVDAVAALLELALIDETGRMEEPEIELRDGVTIVQKDIREVQLAKSAISAGIETLMGEMGVKESDIDRLYLAGGFGNYIDKRSACAIGLLPEGLEDRVTSIGNAAGAGARLMLLGEARAEALRKHMEYIELSGRKGFQDLFAERMLFC